MNYEIIAIIFTSITGPSVAILTVYLEYRKDKKEKLQDRKDMWLDTHFKDMATQLIQLYNLNELPMEENMQETELKSFLYKRRHSIDLHDFVFSPDKFETFLIRINKFQNILDDSGEYFSIKSINEIKNIYSCIFNHIETGYYNIYKNMKELWSEELDYKICIEENIRGILNMIKETIGIQFPELKPSLDYNESYSYNIIEIFWELVRNAKDENVHINLIERNQHGLSFENNDSIFVHLLTSDAEKFINEVWVNLKEKSYDSLKNIINYNKRMLSKESKFKKSLLNIIDLYVAGHAIEGYCDVCDKIYHETDITKLRPKV